MVSSGSSPGQEQPLSGCVPLLPYVLNGHGPTRHLRVLMPGNDVSIASGIALAESPDNLRLSPFDFTCASLQPRALVGP